MTSSPRTTMEQTNNDTDNDEDPSDAYDARLDIFSATFDATFALQNPHRVVLPVRVKPFAYLERCRYLLPPHDALYTVPPQRSAATVARTLANRDAIQQQQLQQQLQQQIQQQNPIINEDPRVTVDSAATPVADVANDDVGANDDVVVEKPSSDRLSISNTLHEMMAPLNHGRFVLLTALRAPGEIATVTMRKRDGVIRIYTGKLELFDRLGNVVLVDARVQPGNRPVPQIFISGAHIYAIARAKPSS
jgi:small nuclear ribonucleoprotein (snRNP)-like protein